MKDLEGIGIQGVIVDLVDADGNAWEVETADDGSYVFQGVEGGSYILRAQKKEGYQFVDPQSGQYEFLVHRGQTIEFNFTWSRDGVVIDFGDPPSTGNGGVRPKTHGLIFNDVISIAVSMRGIQTRTGEKPMHIEIEGLLHMTDQAEANIQIVDASLAATYAMGRVEFENLGGNRFVLRLSSAGWPGFAFDGKLAQLQIAMQSPNGSAGNLVIQTERISMQSAAGWETVPNTGRNLPASPAIQR